MITNTQLQNRFGKFTRNNSALNLAWGEELMNTHRVRRLAGYQYPFLEVNGVLTSVATQSAYRIPKSISKLNTVVYSDTLKDPLYEINSREEYDYLLESASDGTPTHFYVENDLLLIYPTPDTTGDNILLNGEKRIKPMSLPDLTAGTVDVTNGSAIVTGTTTAFTAAYEGAYIQLSDGFWYEVLTVAGANALTLVQPFEGATSVAQGYVLGELEVFPDGFDHLALNDAVADYYRSQEGGLQEAAQWEIQATDTEARMQAEHGNKTTNIGIDTDTDALYPYYGFRY